MVADAGALIAFLFLHRFVVSYVSGVAFLAVAVLASDYIIVLDLFNHDNLVNTSLT